MLMKSLFTAFVLVLTVNAHPASMGKVMQLYGAAERASITTGVRYDTDNNSEINPGEWVRTEKGSFVEIVLSDGTGIGITGESRIYFINMKEEGGTAPTKIEVEYGKVRISSHTGSTGISMIVSTPTALLSVVDADFFLAVSRGETILMVNREEVGAANINPDLKSAYAVKKGQEVSIKTDSQPSSPVFVPASTRQWWLKSIVIINRDREIRRVRMENGILDWLLRKREF